VATREGLIKAMANDEITAIETDILMGHCTFTSNATDCDAPVVIMSHPPAKVSDLGMIDFLEMVSNAKENPEAPAVQHVVKLDFKEYEAIEPTLKAIRDLKITTAGNGAFFVNADVLPGPGNRHEGAVSIDKKAFMEMCLPYMEASPANIAFSLGYKADSMNTDGYTMEDVDAMVEYIQEYKLVEKGIGIVLALNARQLAKSLEVIDKIMEKIPEIQILAWTGKGEFLLPEESYNNIKDHFKEKKMIERIGFDCQVTQSKLRSAYLELGVSFIGNAKKGINLMRSSVK